MGAGRAVDSARYRCSTCGGEWDESKKRAAVAAGEWRATKNINLHVNDFSSRVRGYHFR